MATMDQMAAELLAEQNAQPSAEGQPSTDQMAAELLAEQSAQAAPEAAPSGAPQEYQGFGGAPAAVDPNSISSTVGRSVDNMQAALGGTAEMFGEITGSQGLQDYGKGVREEQKAQATEYGEPTVPTSIKDVEDLGDFGSYLKDMGVKSLAPMATIASGTMAGAAAGSRMAPGGLLGKAVGGFMGGFLGSFGLEAGEIQNAIKEADPEAKSPWAAFAGGTVNSALNAGGATYLLKPAIKMIGEKAVVEGLVKQGLAREAAIAATKTAVMEGGIGAVQAGVTDLSVAGGTGQDVSEDLIYHMLDGAIGGSLLGGAFGGAGKAIEVNAENQRVAGSEAKPAKEQLADINSKYEGGITTETPGTPRETSLDKGAEFLLKDGTPVIATRKVDEKYGDIDIELHTPDGEKVGSVGGADAKHGANFPQPHVEEGFRRKGANTLMYDLLGESGGYVGTRDNKQSARTEDGINFWNSYEQGQSASFREHPAPEPVLTTQPLDKTDADLKTISKLERQIAKDEAKLGKPQTLMGRVWSGFGGSAVDKIQGLAEVSPAAKEVSEAFRPDMTGKTASVKTLFEDADLMAGKWRNETNNVLQGKSEKQLSALFEDVSQTGGPKTPEGAKLRGVLNDVFDTAVNKGGLDTIGYVENHLPTRLDRDRVIADRGKFVDELVIHGRDRLDAEQAVSDWLVKTDPKVEQDMFPKINRTVTVDEATGQPVIAEASRKDATDPESMRYRMGQGHVTPEFGHLERNRSFAELPQSFLNKYAVEQTGKQKAQAVKDYFEGAAHRVASSEKFGPTGDKLNAQVAKSIYEAQQRGRPVQKMEVDRMYDLYDAYHGLHGRIKDARLRQAQSTVGAVMTVATLPLAALSSLTEIVVPAIRGDIQAAVRSSIPALTQMSRDFASTLFKGVPRNEWAQIAAEANISFEAATSVANERLGANMLSRGAAKMTRNFFIINGLSAITHLTRVYAAKTGDYIFQRNLREIANGLPLDSAQGRHRLNQLRSMGIDIRSRSDAIDMYSPQGTAQTRASRDSRVMAIKRFTDQSVLDPNLGSTPLWMNEGRFQTVAMLKRYPAAFGNTILPQLARRFSRDYTGSYSRSMSGAVGSTYLLGMMVGIGYIQDELKQQLKGGDDTRTEEQRFADIVAQSAMNLQGSLLMDSLYNAPRYGQNPVSSVLGPTWGSVADGANAASKTIQSFADEPTAGFAVKYLFKLTPARSFQIAKDFMDGAIEEI